MPGSPDPAPPKPANPLWGPYLSERQWGTVREDYSANGDAWNYFSHDHARSRAYRWGEDGLAGISDEQAAKIRKQELDFRKTEIRGRADLEVKRIDLKALLAADTPDRGAINAKLQEISAAQLSLQKSSVDYRLSMRDAITPEQREKLRQLMRNRWQRDGGRGGRQGEGRGGQRGPSSAPDSQAKPQSND